MKIFISWADPQSKVIAEGLNAWLPKVFQTVETFFSPNIEKGKRGGDEINNALEGTTFGILCLTPGSLEANWIHYEAGALAKTTTDAKTRVWTLLQGLRHSDVKQPLAQFQHTLAEKDDIRKLVESINNSLDRPLSAENLNETFETWWPKLEAKLNEAESAATTGSTSRSGSSKRSDREVLDEILEILRAKRREPTLMEAALRKVSRGFEVSFPRMEGDSRSLEEIQQKVGAAVRRNLPTKGTTCHVDEVDGKISVNIFVDPPMPQAQLTEFYSRLEKAFYDYGI